MAEAVGSAIFDYIVATGTEGAVEATFTFMANYGSYVMLASTMAYSANEARRMQAEAKNAAANAARDRTVTVSGAIVPRDLVLGRARTGGANFYHAVTGPDSSVLYIAQALAGHEIDAIEQIYVNDVPVTLNSYGYVTDAPYLQPSTQMRTEIADSDGKATLQGTVVLESVTSSMVTRTTGDRQGNRDVVSAQAVTVSGSGTTDHPYIAQTTAGATVSYQTFVDLSNDGVVQSLDLGGIGALRFAVHMGGAGQTVDPWLRAEFPTAWLDTFVVQGTAYMVAQLRYDNNSFPNGVPQISARVRGAKVLDARGDPYLSRVVSLISFNGADGATTITDASPLALPWSLVGNAAVSTAQSAFGGASLHLGGAGYARPTDMAAADAYFDLSTGAWTKDLQIRPETLSAVQTLWCRSTANGPKVALELQNGLPALVLRDAAGATTTVYPTGADPRQHMVSSLLHFDGSNGDTIVDSGPLGLAWSTVGNAAINTAASVYGTGSLRLGGAGYARPTDMAAADPYFDFDSDDFAIEQWVTLDSSAGIQTVAGRFDATGAAIALRINNGVPEIYIRSADGVEVILNEYYGSGSGGGGGGNNSGGVTDGAGESGYYDQEGNFFSNVSPAVQITTNKASLSAGETAIITFRLNSSYTDFSHAAAQDWIHVEGGALSGFSGSGRVYTATFTPFAFSHINGVIAIGSNTFRNSYGYNLGNAALTFAINTANGGGNDGWALLKILSMGVNSGALIASSDGSIYIETTGQTRNYYIYNPGNDSFSPVSLAITDGYTSSSTVATPDGFVMVRDDSETIGLYKRSDNSLDYISRMSIGPFIPYGGIAISPDGLNLYGFSVPGQIDSSRRDNYTFDFYSYIRDDVTVPLSETYWKARQEFAEDNIDQSQYHGIAVSASGNKVCAIVNVPNNSIRIYQRGDEGLLTLTQTLTSPVPISSVAFSSDGLYIYATFNSNLMVYGRN